MELTILFTKFKHAGMKTTPVHPRAYGWRLQVQRRYCHMFMAAWLTITDSGSDDWIYWHLLVESLNHKQLQELPISLQPNYSSLTAEDSLHSPPHSTTHCSKSESKSHCDWRSVSQSVSLSIEPSLGLMTRYLLQFDNLGLVFVGRPLWREDWSVFCRSHCLQ
jgi:hypothetical protein